MTAYNIVAPSAPSPLGNRPEVIRHSAQTGEQSERQSFAEMLGGRSEGTALNPPPQPSSAKEEEATLLTSLPGKSSIETTSPTQTTDSPKKANPAKTKKSEPPTPPLEGCPPAWLLVPVMMPEAPAPAISFNAAGAGESKASDTAIQPTTGAAGTEQKPAVQVSLKQELQTPSPLTAQDGATARWQTVTPSTDGKSRTMAPSARDTGTKPGDRSFLAKDSPAPEQASASPATDGPSIETYISGAVQKLGVLQPNPTKDGPDALLPETIPTTEIRASQSTLLKRDAPVKDSAQGSSTGRAEFTGFGPSKNEAKLPTPERTQQAVEAPQNQVLLTPEAKSFIDPQFAKEIESTRQQMAGKALTENPIFQLEIKQPKESSTTALPSSSGTEASAQPTGDKGSSRFDSQVLPVSQQPSLPPVTGTPDARYDARGTLAAKQPYEMKTSAEPVESALGAVQKVPSREHDSTMPKAELSAYMGQASLIRPATPAELVAVPHQVQAASSVEKTINSIHSEVMVMRRMQPDALSVVLRPDAGTEIVVQMTNKNGEVHAHIRCERGDFDGLNAQWGDLESTMAAQGVKLAPLLPSSRSNPHDDFRTDLGQGFNGQNAPREDRRSPMDSLLSNQDAAPSRNRRATNIPTAQPILTGSVSNAAWQKWA